MANRVPYKDTSRTSSDCEMTRRHFSLRRNLKIVITCILITSMIFSLAACGDKSKDETKGEVRGQVSDQAKDKDFSEPLAKSKQQNSTKYASADSWSIYWYMCGSDLESDGGFATDDLEELMQVRLPEGVNVVIQTGGSAEWQNDYVDASKLQRFVYNSEGLKLLEEKPPANMGDKQTLYEFLDFSFSHYPSEKMAVVFWNHGGGSVSGAEFDELFDFDALTLDEMYEAFNGVWDASVEDPPLEFIGFDTCLMATIDVAATFSGFARYLVASEEVEPAGGWDYSQWIGALASNPGMDGAALGKIICDSYYASCEKDESDDIATLSVTDLSKIQPLIEAYDAFGAECLEAAIDDPSFLSKFARGASKSENYGGNTREEGYTNMVDLGDLAKKNIDLLNSAEDVLAALDECIVYQVKGKYRARANGLSCYYSFNGDVDDFNSYKAVGVDSAFKHYFSYVLTGNVDDSGMDYIDDFDYSDLPDVPSLLMTDWDGALLDMDDEGTAILELGPEADEILVGIGFQLYYVDEEEDIMMLLGTDNDMDADWENGIFYDNFRGVWGAIDGCIVYMELSEEGDDYNLYSVPILLNGEEYSLQVVYDFNDEEWIILGAREGIDDYGMADKDLRKLKVGDEITTIWKLASYSGDDDFEDYEADTITVTRNTAFSEEPLYDGTYCMIFEMWDAMGNYAYSDLVQFDIEDGEIYTTIFE